MSTSIGGSPPQINTDHPLFPTHDQPLSAIHTSATARRSIHRSSLALLANIGHSQRLHKAASQIPTAALNINNKYWQNCVLQPQACQRSEKNMLAKGLPVKMSMPSSHSEVTTMKMSNQFQSQSGLQKKLRPCTDRRSRSSAVNSAVYSPCTI